MKNILIGGAWPYANGSLHLGHVAGLLPGDIIARYYRLIGANVYYVSGSDCYGTPVTIRAKKENTTPLEISDNYHKEFSEVFQKLGFSYDYYGKTSSEEHINFVQEFHKQMYQGEYIYEKEVQQVYCEKCNTFLADRYVHGLCPKCGSPARGDQCDACGIVLEPETLIDPHCSICGEVPTTKETKHLYLAVSKLDNQIRNLVDAHPEWRKNAIAFTNRYLKEGLRDRAITRSLSWGIDVPMEGYEDKKIYIWAENVLGYLSMSDVAVKDRGDDFDELWGENALHYYVHAKDNIPFHTIILPALLSASNKRYHLPDRIISNEYLTLEGRKISTSQNWAIWLKDIVDRYQPDSIRYFMIANGPEKRDTDFTWREFYHSHNGELLGAYGNFINRSLVFIQKYFNGVVPEGILIDSIKNQLLNLYDDIGRLIEEGNLKEALDQIFEFIRNSNKYFDTEQPWNTRSTNLITCNHTLYNCIQIIANISLFLEPFLPFSSSMVINWLGLKREWAFQAVPSGYQLPEIVILFERLDHKNLDDELGRLKGL